MYSTAIVLFIGMIVVIAPDGSQCEKQWEMVRGGPRAKGEDTLTHMEYGKNGSKTPETERKSKDNFDDHSTPVVLSLNKTQIKDVPEEIVGIQTGSGETLVKFTTNQKVKMPSESGNTNGKESKSEEVKDDETAKNDNDNSTEDSEDKDDGGGNINDDDEDDDNNTDDDDVHNDDDNDYDDKLDDIVEPKNDDENTTEDSDDKDDYGVYIIDDDEDDNKTDDNDSDNDGDDEYIDIVEPDDNNEDNFDDNYDDCDLESNSTSVLPANKTEADSIGTNANIPQETTGTPPYSREVTEKPVTNTDDGNISFKVEKRIEIDKLNISKREEEENTNNDDHEDDADVEKNLSVEDSEDNVNSTQNTHDNDHFNQKEDADEKEIFSSGDNEDNVNNSTRNDESTEYYGEEEAEGYSGDDKDLGSGDEDDNDEKEESTDHISEKKVSETEANIQNENHRNRAKRQTKNVDKIVRNPKNTERDDESCIDEVHPIQSQSKRSISEITNDQWLESGELGSGDFSGFNVKQPKDESIDLNSGVKPAPAKDDNRSEEVVSDDNFWVKYFNKPRRIINA